MFCSKCGHQLDDGAKFCSVCGQPVAEKGQEENYREEAAGSTVHESTQQESQQQYQQQSSYAAGSGSGSEMSGEDEKINWKEYLTMENIERFAPFAALMPLGLWVITGILGGLFGAIPGVGVVFRVIVAVLKILFVILTIGATAGLVYIAVKKKDMTKVYTWIAPVGTFLAVLSCLGIALGWGVVAWICGLISVILGLEFLSRIVIGNQPMDSPFNPSEAVSSYKKYYQDYKAKYATTKDLERAGIVDPEKSQFDGSGLELLGYTLLLILVSGITCGIAAPWMICKIYKWRVGHTVINGKRLTFTGTGASLLGHWILWEILTVITLGIYAFFAHVALRKWELSNTFIEGEPIVANGKDSYFDGGSFAYFGYGFIGGLLLLITCGLAYPWVMAMLQKWDTRHQVINRRRLVFSGTGLGFLGEYIIIVLLSLITCGIYAPWGKVRMNKYIVRHTDFVN